MKNDSRDIFQAALRAVDPFECVRRHAGRVEARLRADRCERLAVLAFGKAACAMTRGLLESLPACDAPGIVVTKYGHVSGTALPERIAVFEAGHPVPDENGVSATVRAVDLVRSAGADALVVCLISGGGSALLAAPREGITLGEKQEMTRLLLEAGADIVELNTVRKHVSRVKGGRLAEDAAPAGVISLILSDVIGDRLDSIASGPTAPDETTYGDALQVLERYRLTGRVPGSVLRTLARGARGDILETPKPGSPLFGRVENVIVGSNRLALEAVQEKAREMGYEAVVLTSELRGEARDAARWLAGKAREARSGRTGDGRPLCLISGGETTVTVTGSGIGGRNTELALAFALEIEGLDGITLLSAGTDGTDGPTDAAGAFADGNTAIEAGRAGLDPGAFLTNNDSYTFFKKAGGLLVTGPTGTNVMDIQILLLR
ncbi:MAG: glycerate kinase [Syntrophaceae bacterium]|nr:glycerate kinase [Syntrophaceae bacterium]